MPIATTRRQTIALWTGRVGSVLSTIGVALLGALLYATVVAGDPIAGPLLYALIAVWALDVVVSLTTSGLGDESDDDR